MFAKLNKEIIISEYKQEGIRTVYGNNLLKYCLVSNVSFDMYSLIPERYRQGFVLLDMQSTNILSPHTDDRTLCTINVYVEPCNCVTTFYELKPDTDINVFTMNSASTGRLFSKSHLNSIGSFVAQKNEAWILDVTKPHSVYPCVAGEKINRLAIALQTSIHSYEQVVVMLKETNYL